MVDSVRVARLPVEPSIRYTFTPRLGRCDDAFVVKWFHRKDIERVLIKRRRAGSSGVPLGDMGQRTEPLLWVLTRRLQNTGEQMDGKRWTMRCYLVLILLGNVDLCHSVQAYTIIILRHLIRKKDEILHSLYWLYFVSVGLLLHTYILSDCGDGGPCVIGRVQRQLTSHPYTSSVSLTNIITTFTNCFIRYRFRYLQSADPITGLSAGIIRFEQQKIALLEIHCLLKY